MDFKDLLKNKLMAAANPTITGNTYAGIYLDDAIPPLVLDPAGLEDHGLATVYDRTKDSGTLYEIDDTVDFQDASPDFQDQGTTANMEEINLTMVPYDFGKKVSLDAIRTSWMSGKLAAGSLNDYTLDELVSLYVSNVYVSKLKMAQDNLVLRGKTGLDASIGAYSFSAGYSGVYTLFNAATGINKVSIAADQIAISAVVKGTTTALTVATDVRDSLQVGNMISIRNAGGTGWSVINGDWKVLSLTATSVVIGVDTSALTNGDYDTNGTIQYINANNIIKKLGTHLRVIPQSVYSENSKLVLPRHLEVEWNLAVGEAQQNGGSYVLKAFDLSMVSKQIVFLDNAPANTIGTWTEKHVFYGYDLKEDYSNIEVLWQGNTTGNKVYHVQGKMKTGVAITNKFEDEITLSTPDA